MNLTIPVSIPQSPSQMGYKDASLWIGSCFTEKIGNKLSQLKFKTCINPSGIIYNPVSIQKIISRIIEKRLYTENDLNFLNGLYYSNDHHGSFSHPEKKTCLDGINKKLTKASDFISESAFLLITLGSAWVFSDKITGEVVANCHKRPASDFEKEILTFQETAKCLQETIQSCTAANPSLKIIFTVSPVRHNAYGAIGNMHSKAVLISAIHEVIPQFSNCYYFPAFEIMMDELRDYRFYADDMIHPSSLAENIIFEKFTHTIIEQESLKTIPAVEKVIRAAAHKPLHPADSTLKSFSENMLKEIHRLTIEFPFLDFSAEIEIFKKNVSC
ncbi:MAG: GSCFA domain-containing protein [Bacteroidota bacterium]